MKLADHVEHIRKLIDTAFRNRLGRMGIMETSVLIRSSVPNEYLGDRIRIDSLTEIWTAETGSAENAYEKLVEELTFTLFNRLAALKVMEAHTLHPEIVTRRSQHGDRSFAHKHWLEQNPNGRNKEMEGLVRFMEDQLAALAGDIPLFSPQHPYHLLPTAIELSGIMNAFNQVETDAQVEENIWQSDDVLGWLYESYNNYKKAAHKESGDKTEFNKVSIQSQVYTPRWVVKFLVDNSLGKLYLEMYPDSDIKNRYKIANAPKTRTREPKSLTEIRMIDPATGSGNFLLYGFDLFYDLYTDQIDNYGADYDDRKIAELIIAHNLHGVDLDDRVIQLAQLGLYIKAKRKKRSAKIEHFNIVSSDFYLPEYVTVKHLFESEEPLSPELEKIVTDLWADLQQAYKFGALIRLEEKFSLRLHGLVQQFERTQMQLFSAQTLASYENFRDNFFTNLQKAVAQNTAKQGQTFLNTKTRDAITFLQLLTQKYDVAVANPPYTDSADFGTELKKFVDANYKQPYKFNSNLYAAFIKRCCELTDETGYVALIHPHTFMFIKTFEDVRKYLIEHTHIDLLVDYGLDRVNLFGPGILLDATWYVLSKNKKDETGIYFNITANQQEKTKQGSLEQAYDDVIHKRTNNRVYTLPQEKLKIIEGWPFIYWISDGFREKFKEKTVNVIASVTEGFKSNNNEKILRHIWEVCKEISAIENYVFYTKGGKYNKWYGNIWLAITWLDNGDNQLANGASLTSKDLYFKEGITYTKSGSKGPSFRYLPSKLIFDSGSPSIFLSDIHYNLNYLLAFLNSFLGQYVLNCLNPTVNIQVSDIKRLPIVKPPRLIEENISALAGENVFIKKGLNSFRVIETDFTNTPILAYSDSSLKDRLIRYFNFENAQITQVLLNEAVINQLIFKVYDLSEEDRLQVETKMGKPVGKLPVLNVARKAYQLEHALEQEIVKKHIANLEAIEFDAQQVEAIKSELRSLYQSNNDLEEFCIRHQVNPINVWYWFKVSKVLPQARVAEIALEFLADAFRTILIADEDGIVPLVGLPGEPRLMDRFEEYCFSKGFTSAQIMQLDALIGRPVNEYVEHYFFKNFSDHLNLFMYLPKTPFIWHLSSGEYQGFETYIIIYKWNRDSLYKLKSNYLSKRTESLQYRLQQIADSTTGQAQTEKETIRLQLQEIDAFAQKIDQLIAEGYDPKLDDGVGKNIAPLQAKGMLKAEVLKTTGGQKSQLNKYLNADW
ncbi:BREX-1 system adenine-specific DNA-methyltransferase PglX [Agriterribacter sp.]|uniref:BREX-1 system adenine-specific DNA-methyltransferase PglX n=1 Tax=Agriterribacter sp. TaxID=2821509 RepID=UPI002D15B690|nr:BREX-1 system adenine-specific DNA-methyltransferase PglX [Agriterribacter sp.]HRO46473.1 BREX-1 system adenine-specific DNA-methyltransferase PglX [Agriterribacter sp.]HRQ17372.1 BREX-1 system adenine-specific DNA-methyltransferase PglX [Agriterribacter sp.]